MEDNRKLEIATEIMKWHYRQLCTEKFMGLLKAVAEDCGIPDEEMFEFYKHVSDNMP